MKPASATIEEEKVVLGAATGPSTLVLKIPGHNVSILHGEQVVFAGPVRWTGKKTKIGLNPTEKDRTTGCGCTNSEFFRLPVAMFVEKSKNRKKPV